MAATDSRIEPVWLLVVIAGLLLIRFAAPLLVPIVIAVLLSYALGPIEGWLHDNGLPRWVPTTATMLVLVAAIVCVAALLLVQGRTALEQLPAAAERLRGVVADSPMFQPLIREGAAGLQDHAMRWAYVKRWIDVPADGTCSPTAHHTSHVVQHDTSPRRRWLPLGVRRGRRYFATITREGINRQSGRAGTRLKFH